MNNEDRELLELAAKAAGISRYYLYYPVHKGIVSESGMGQIAYCWNPLLNDGDALRLAVKLSLEIIIECSTGAVTAGVVDGWWKEERFEDEGYAATRRAIVRAAAEIGRQK